MTSPQEDQKSDSRDRKSGFGNGKAMVGIQKVELDSLIGKAYSHGASAHGDLGLAFEDFAARLKSIITKGLGADPALDATTRFVAGVCSDDLYLATACARNIHRGWDRLFKLYNDHINSVAHSICSTHQEARELASSLLAYLFFRDRQGQSRIASYGGRGSLGAWIATIIKHQAINHRQLKSNEALPLDSARQTASATAQSELDAVLLNCKYKDAIADSLRAAVGCLSEREKLVLVLQLEDELRAAEIARRFSVHRAQMTRAIHRAENKLRMALLAHLSSHHGLAPEEIEECVAHMIQSPETSVGIFLRTAA